MGTRTGKGKLAPSTTAGAFFLLTGAILILLGIVLTIFLLKDFGLKTILYRHSVSVPRTVLLHDFARISFRAYAPRLGSIGIEFDTRNKVNKDAIQFTIAEIGSRPFYSNSYRTDHFPWHAVFPFGFTPQVESQGKAYTISLAPTARSTPSDHVILKPGKSIIAVYAAPDRLASFEGVWFIVQKLLSYVHNTPPLLFLPGMAVWAVYLAFAFFSRGLLSRFDRVLSQFLHSWAKAVWSNDFVHVAWGELAFVLGFFVYFFDAALLAGKRPVGGGAVWVIVALLHVAFLFSLVRAVKRRTLRVALAGIGRFWPVVVVAVLYVVIRFSYRYDIPRWDGSVYFEELRNAANLFQFQLSQYIDKFNWFGHPSYGYSTYLAPLQFFAPSSVVPMHLSNMLLLLVTGLAMASLGYRMGRKSVFLATVAAVVTLFNPLLFGISLSPNLDFGSACLFALTLWALYTNRFVLLAFFGTATVFSKETAIPFLLVLFSSYAVLSIIRSGEKLRQSRRAADFFRTLSYYVVAAAVPFAAFALYYFLSKGRVWVGNATVKQAFTEFGFEYFSQKSIQLFLLNFSYVFLALIIARAKHILKNPFSVSLLITLFAHALFNLFYVTYPHPRYIAFGIPLLILLAVFSLPEHLKNTGTKIAVVLFSLVMFLQVFYLIDPVSKTALKTFRFGDQKMLRIGDKNSSAGDALVYNAQHVAIGRLYNLLFSRVSPDQQTAFIISTPKQTSYQISYWHAGLFNNEVFSGVFFDPIQERLTFQTSNTLRPILINQTDFIARAARSFSKYYFVSLPWLDVDNDGMLPVIKEKFIVGKKNTVSLNGYAIDYYELTIRNK